MKMKVILVSCLIFGVAQATLPGFGGSSSGGGGLNILGDLTGVFGSLFRSLSGGQSNHDHSTSGEVVDGQGGGVSGGSSDDFGGYAYSAPATIDQGVSADGGYDYKPANPQPAYGAPQAAQAVAPQENYGPPKPAYGPPAPAPVQQYGAPQVAHQVAPQASYGAPAPAPVQQYGAPQAAHQVAPQQSYGPPSDSYGAPAGGHSSGGHSSGGQSSEGHSQGSSSSSSSSGESSGSGFDLGGTIVKWVWTSKSF